MRPAATGRMVGGSRGSAGQRLVHRIPTFCAYRGGGADYMMLNARHVTTRKITRRSFCSSLASTLALLAAAGAPHGRRRRTARISPSCCSTTSTSWASSRCPTAASAAALRASRRSSRPSAPRRGEGARDPGAWRRHAFPVADVGARPRRAYHRAHQHDRARHLRARQPRVRFRQGDVSASAWARPSFRSMRPICAMPDGAPLPGFKDRAIVDFNGVRIGLTGLAYEHRRACRRRRICSFASTIDTTQRAGRGAARARARISSSR